MTLEHCKRYALWLPLLCAAGAGICFLGRELWFDEALTVTNFMLPLTPAEIYRTYPIPNNQIVYTIALRLWHDLMPETAVDPVAFWRVLSLLFAMGGTALLLALRQRMRKKILWSDLWVLCAFALSPVFCNYGTALRGYAMSWMWIALALHGAYDIFHDRTTRGFLIYSLAALGAVGTVPTNLLALGAAGLYALPWSRRDFLRDGRVWGLAAVPFLALALFYLPIGEAFLKTFTLHEGFHGRFRALALFYGAVLVTFGILLGAEVLRWQAADEWRLRWARAAVWLLPFPAFFCLHQAPFPRVLSTLFPVFILLLCDGLATVRWTRGKVLGGVAAWAAVQVLLNLEMGPLAARAGFSCYEDDYLAPWYMARDYSIRKTVEEFRRHLEIRTLFLSFNSDPCPLLFYAVLEDYHADFQADLPLGRVGKLPPDAWFVLREDDVVGAFEGRFRRRLIPAGRCGRLRLYRSGAK